MFGIKLYMFRTVPLSTIRSFSLYTQQWYMSYRFADSLRAGSGRNCSSVLILLASCNCNLCAVCTVKNSWWWTEELSETCRVLFQTLVWEISVSSRFCYKNWCFMVATFLQHVRKYSSVLFCIIDVANKVTCFFILILHKIIQAGTFRESAFLW